MKKIFGIMSLLAVMVGLVGCAGNNNDDDDGSNEELVGMWWAYSQSGGGDWKFIDDERIFDLRKDGTCVFWKNHLRRGEGRWSCDGDVVKMKNESSGYEWCFVIERKNDTVMYVRECEEQEGALVEKFKKVKDVTYVNQETNRIMSTGREVEQW